MERYFDALVDSLWSPQSYLKVAFLALTYPIWGKLVKAMWEEMREALAPEGGIFAREKRRAVHVRPPGLDPFLNIPTPAYREVLEKRARDRRTHTRRAAREPVRELAPVERAPVQRTPTSRGGGFRGPARKRGF